MTSSRITLSIPPEQLAGVLDGHCDFRVQRRVGVMDRRDPTGDRAGGRAGLALAIGTSGSDHRRHQIVELSIQTFRIDARSRIVETGSRRTWLEEAATPISRGPSRMSDLEDADLFGRAISEGEATGLLLDADFVVAHDAGATRPFVEARLPMAVGRPWACSMRDLDWAAEGFEGSRLTELIAPMGWFYEAHRAEADVSALLHLLDHRLDDGTTVVGRMLDRADRPTWLVDAADAPSSAEDVLQDRGYHWDDLRRIWSASITEEAVADEIAWGRMMLYGGRREPSARRMTWRERYA